MFCPNCNTEIKDHDNKQCPQCNSLLLEIVEQEVSENGVKADKAPEESRKATEPDEFDALLEGIAADIDQILAADKEGAAASEAQVVRDDEVPVEEPEAVIELTERIELEEILADDLEDYPIDDLDPLIQEFDELTAKDNNSETDALNDYEPQAPEQDEVPVEEPEVVIELTERVEPEDVVEDELIETVTDRELEAVYDLDPEPMQDDGLLEEIIEDDLISADVVEEITEDEFVAADVIEEITEDDFVSIKVLTIGVADQASIAAPATSKRAPKNLIVSAGMVMLLLAAVLGGRFYLKTKKVPATIPLKPSASVANQEADKVLIPKESTVNRKPQPAGQSIEQQQTDTVTEPAPDRPKVAVPAQQVNAEQKPRVADKESEPQITDIVKSLPEIAAESKIAPPSPGEKSIAKPAVSAKVVKSDTAGSYIAAEELYFTIQVATFKDKTKTESSLAKLRQDGYAAYISEKVESTGAVRYKLRIGKYKTRKAAKQAAESYSGSKQAPYIIVQSKEVIKLKID